MLIWLVWYTSSKHDLYPKNQDLMQIENYADAASNCMIWVTNRIRLL